MAQREDPGARPGARELTALFGPLRFAARDGGAGLARVAGLGGTIQGAVQHAIAAGAPAGGALGRLAAAAAGFDALPAARRLQALCVIAAELGTLVPLPEDLEALARRGRIPEPAPAATGTVGARRAAPAAGAAPKSP
ncbi:MAG TPA: DNA helicase RecG, partial [Anaeromyxobacteraceae bacterium]|nr:DNA helicase RecG [Anaeromyxobacteraceae bacterium]